MPASGQTSEPSPRFAGSRRERQVASVGVSEPADPLPSRCHGFDPTPPLARPLHRREGLSPLKAAPHSRIGGA
jgi:hypothetical protein